MGQLDASPKAGQSFDLLVVLEREIILGNLLETKNNGASRSVLDPCALLDKCSTNLFVFRVLENALELGVCGGSFDGDGVSSIDEGLDDSGREGSVLERLLLGTKKNCRVSRHRDGEAEEEDD